MSKTLFATIILGVLVAGVLPAGASDWPQWRGANRDAVAGATEIADRWPEGGPKVVWRAKVGSGYSSVSISDGKAYTLWDEGGSQFLFALDARTGAELWRHKLGPAFKNHYGDGPRSTPVVDGAAVYAIGTSGLLVAANKISGELLWNHNLVGEFKADLPSYGYSSSPLVVDGRLLVEAGGARAAFMAFDKKTGEVAWSSQSDTPAYSSPIAVAIDGVQQVVFWSAHGLHSVSPVDGRLLWRYSWETFCPVSGDPLNTGTPIFMAPDRIFISSGSGAAVIRPVRRDDAFRVETVWKSERMRSDVNTAVALGHFIYGFDREFLQCIDARDGTVRWKARGFKRGSLIAADGMLIVLGEGGNLALVEANPVGFVERSQVQVLSGKSWTAPSLADGKLYLRNHDEMVCLDLGG